MIHSVSLSPPSLKTDTPHRERAGDRFAQSLAAFLDADEGKTPDPKVAGERKEAAAPGKPLPDEDRRDDAALVWLMTMAPPIPVPAPPVASSPVTLPAVGDAKPGATSPAPFGLNDVEGQTTPANFGLPLVPPVTDRKTINLLASADGTVPPPNGIAADEPAISVKRDVRVEARRIDQGATQPPMGDLKPTTTPVSVTAAQVFGAAMLEAAGHEDKRARIDGDIAPLAPPRAQVEAQRHAVVATGDAQQAPLDMGHDRWPHRMIERIESMRDAADAADTRIRLVPDALGTIDVSMRRDGEAVHVHFAAEQAATAKLLTDAQPRLAELAEARGIKLGGSAVDSGGADARQNRAPLPAPLPQAPVRVAAEPTTTDDARIA